MIPLKKSVFYVIATGAFLSILILGYKVLILGVIIKQKENSRAQFALVNKEIATAQRILDTVQKAYYVKLKSIDSTKNWPSIVDSTFYKRNQNEVPCKLDLRRYPLSDTSQLFILLKQKINVPNASRFLVDTTTVYIKELSSPEISFEKNGLQKNIIINPNLVFSFKNEKRSDSIRSIYLVFSRMTSMTGRINFDISSEQIPNNCSKYSWNTPFTIPYLVGYYEMFVIVDYRMVYTSRFLAKGTEFL